MKEINLISVDDNSVNLLLIEALAKDVGLTAKSFTNAPDALVYAENNDVDIILTDYMMPVMHGIDFIKAVRKIHTDVPIVMITAVTDDNRLKIDALEAGATEFLNKPLNPTEFKVRIQNLTKLRKAQLLLKDRALLLEDEVKKTTKVIEDREKETLTVLSKAAEYKDQGTAEHIARVASYSTLIVREYGKSKAEQELIYFAAPLHDVGKIGISDAILTKPGIYTPEEFEIMKKHPAIGYEMLKASSSPYLKAGADIALSHHEKFNGKGYPSGMKGEEIPLYGRIVAIADVFDALTTVRPYKEAWSLERAMELVVKERGEHFDPQFVDIFVKKIDEVKRIFDGNVITF